MLQVATKLTDGNVAKEIPLVNVFEGVQKIVDIRLQDFKSVVVKLTKSITIIVTGIFFRTMTNGGSILLYAVIALTLISIDQCFFAEHALYFLPSHSGTSHRSRLPNPVAAYRVADGQYWLVNRDECPAPSGSSRLIFG